MNITTSNIKTNFVIDDPKKISRNRLIKSSSTTSNNYSVYEKYINKISFYKKKSRNTENNIKKSNSSLSKFQSKLGNSQNSFNLSNFEGEKNNNFSAFSKIMEHYFQQKKKEMLKRKQNIPLRKNFSKNKKIVVEINTNNSNSNNKKNNKSTNNLINNRLNQLTKKKTDIKKDINISRLKTTRNRNLSMKDIDNNISYTSNFKILNSTNSNKSKIKNENIIVKKIFHSSNNQIKINKIKNPTSPTYFSNTSRNINLNKLIRPITKLNSLNNNESNIIEISALEKKYNKLFNSNDNNKISTSRNISSKGNYTSLSEVTKPNTLNTKVEKKDDELEGPELIHFSLVELIQKGRKKMEEIVCNLNKNNK